MYRFYLFIYFNLLLLPVSDSTSQQVTTVEHRRRRAPWNSFLGRARVRGGAGRLPGLGARAPLVIVCVRFDSGKRLTRGGLGFGVNDWRAKMKRASCHRQCYP